MARILVIDDDATARELALVTLNLEGHDVVLAGDGRYALLELARDPSFDLVVLDLQMPWVDGDAVLDRLAPASPPVLVWSAAEPPGSVPVAGRLTKPTTPEELVDAVDAVLATDRSLR